ncbi:unnamed protein product [Scytosiphon promiscuus]
MGQEMRLTSDNSSQTSSDASPIEPATPTTDAPIYPLSAPTVRHAWSPLNQRIILGLLAVVVLLLGTNAYSFNQTRAWKAESSALQAKVAKLEKVTKTPMRHVDPPVTPPSCPGSQLIDTCWFKVGWGDCTKEVMEDPIKPVEDAFRYAWDTTSDVIGLVAGTIVSDVREGGGYVPSRHHVPWDLAGSALNPYSFSRRTKRQPTTSEVEA